MRSTGVLKESFENHTKSELKPQRDWSSKKKGSVGHCFHASTQE